MTLDYKLNDYVAQHGKIRKLAEYFDRETAKAQVNQDYLSVISMSLSAEVIREADNYVLLELLNQKKAGIAK